MEEKVFFDGELGKICGVINKVNKNKEIAIIVPGFSSSKDSGAKDIAKKLNEIGINTIRIDLDNMGESELDFETGATIPNYIKQINATINYCKSQRYTQITLVGTSYGGLAVFASALTHPEIKRLIMRAPVVDYKKHAIEKYGKKLVEIEKQGFVPYEKNGKIYKRTFNSIKDAYPYSMFENAQKIKCPVLIIQGTDDKIVNPEDAKKSIKYFQNARLHLIKGASHHLGVNGDFSESLDALAEFFQPGGQNENRE